LAGRKSVEAAADRTRTHSSPIADSRFVGTVAAGDSADWLPATLPENPASVHLYTLVWLLPVLIYDITRRGPVHRVYWIGLALNVPFVIATHLLWGSPWWLATAPRLIGVQGWYKGPALTPPRPRWRLTPPSSSIAPWTPHSCGTKLPECGRMHRAASTLSR